MSTATEVYRDATYTKQTQEDLVDLLAWLETQHHCPGQFIDAVTDVTRRWDENDATETTFPA